MTYLCSCGYKNHSEEEYVEHWKECKEIKKMTREQALEKLGNVDNVNKPINARESNYVLMKKLEALGVIEFERENPYLVAGGHQSDCFYRKGKEIIEKFGAVKVELWPEGLVLWVGGEIVWKSWEKVYRKGDRAMVKTDAFNLYNGTIE